MSHWRRLSYSVSGAVIITALAVLFYREGGELLVIPGMLAEIYLNVFFMLMNTDDDWYSAPAGTYAVFNVIVYSFLFYVFSWVGTGIKDSLKKRDLSARAV